jgi:twinkle protein
VCRRAGYWTGKFNGQPVQVANIRNSLTGALEAQKVRFPNKDFLFLGDSDELFGMHLWKDGGKKIVITEGEIDILTVMDELQDYRGPSCPSRRAARARRSKSRRTSTSCSSSTR